MKKPSKTNRLSKSQTGIFEKGILTLNDFWLLILAYRAKTNDQLAFQYHYEQAEAGKREFESMLEKNRLTGQQLLNLLNSQTSPTSGVKSFDARGHQYSLPKNDSQSD